MKYVITGAGQIGAQLAADLVGRGDEVVVIRRSGAPGVPGASIMRGDAWDTEILRAAAAGAAGIFHCIHAAYNSRVWARELPPREQSVMDAAEELGIPVIFPESVYAFGHASRDLTEGAATDPCSPLGEVRAHLLAAREAHRAITISLVASDLFGPTAGAGSVAHATVITPVQAGRRAFVMADPEAPHSWTYLPDLTAAMIFSAEHASQLAPGGDAVLHAPTPAARSIRALAEDVATLASSRRPRITAVPASLIGALRLTRPAIRELHAQRYLWREPAVLQPGALTTRGLRPTEWEAALATSLGAHATPRRSA